jgi:hypothetical protein
VFPAVRLIMFAVTIGPNVQYFLRLLGVGDRVRGGAGDGAARPPGEIRFRRA